MLKGFKEFVLRGNVIDLAVAVVVGAAFTAIVTALVDGFINPLIGLIFQVGDLATWTIEVPTLIDTGTPTFSTFAPGAIVASVIKLLLVAIVLYFAFVLPMNKIKERQAARAGTTEDPEEPGLPTEQELLVQIRDLLSDTNRPSSS